jgi:putative Mg2+ transporter-C (MgtC) family protein
MFAIDWNWVGTIALRLLIAGILGSIIGFEREHSRQPAGLRTHILVCIGAALVMITSEHLLQYYGSSDLIRSDPARMGASVISGIGFLGAGTIIRNGGSVRGLTTAAGLWAVACIGLACGIGFYEGALLATALAVITLLLTHPLQRWHVNKSEETVLLIRLASFNQDVANIVNRLLKASASVNQFQILPDEESGFRLRLSLNGCSQKDKAELVFSLTQLPNVISIQDENT